MRVIIVGGGEVGSTIAELLSQERSDVTLIDSDPERAAHIESHLDVRTIVGNGATPSVLIEAGIESAEMLIAATNSDEVNLLACFIAGAKSPTTTKIARVRDSNYIEHAELLEAAGLKLDLAINPEAVTVEKIQRMLSVPTATDVATFADGRVLMAAMRVRADSPLANARLSDLAALRPSPDVLLVAINRGGRVLIPTGSDVVEPDDVVYAVVETKKVDKLIEFFAVEQREAKSVMVHGGGRISLLLGKALEQQGVHVKIIERRARRCEELSRQLEKAVVLRGDAMDPELLEEEGVDHVDAFISLTSDQEDNILSALLAKRLGAKTVMALIDRQGYSTLVSTIGIDVPLSPRLTAVSSILQFVRKGNVRSVVAFQEDEAEAMEVEAMETSSIVGAPLKDIKFPKGAIIGAVVRGGHTFIPRGTDVIEPGDRVVIFALKKAIKQVEKAVCVSLEFF